MKNTIAELVKEKLKNPEFKKYYNEAGIKLDTAMEIFNLRKSLGLTRKALAYKVDLSIKRIERAEEADLGINEMKRIRDKIAQKIENKEI